MTEALLPGVIAFQIDSMELLMEELNRHNKYPVEIRGEFAKHSVAKPVRLTGETDLLKLPEDDPLMVGIHALFDASPCGMVGILEVPEEEK